jgi:sec-independent protein translocase protein TatB
MIDLGLSKLALIGVVALVVVGPERLPRVARMAGALIGRAQRYIADVKAEVSREIEVDELRKMRTEFEDAARNVEKTIHKEVNEQSESLNQAFSGEGDTATPTDYATGYSSAPSWTSATKPRNGRNSWRNKTSAMPKWYKQQHGVRGWVQSGAARVKRHRPVKRAPKSFFE